MPAKLFITGGTGYIGGDALHEIVQAHPEYDITCLARNSDKAAKIGAQYPRVRFVYGTLDDSSVLEAEAKEADVVLNFAHADHANAARALIRGLAAHSDDKPGYLIHTSGARLLSFKDIETKTFGEASSKVYDDWDGVGEVISLPDSAPHRDVENIVLAGGTAGLKTAIVCPPTIYGRGRGPDNQRSDQLPELARYTLIEKHGIQIGAGNSYWTNVHITDLSKCYLLLVEAAVTGGGSATWGEKGYYFTENNEHVWGHISKLVAEEAHKQGLIPSDEVISFTPENANILKSPTAMTWGFNSRCRAIRARKVLGWEPKECKIEDTIADAVKTEAVSMGLIEGHAAKIAG